MLGWDQQKLSQEAGVSRGTIISFESGERLPTAANVVRIKECFETARIKFFNDRDQIGVILQVGHYEEIQESR